MQLACNLKWGLFHQHTLITETDAADQIHCRSQPTEVP